ncbi:hypothetical protein TNCV_1413681 [Trichonephila clavipes]|nr:hypothetical protein TNCV_1413681 [Trichonephila clavipes]
MPKFEGLTPAQLADFPDVKKLAAFMTYDYETWLHSKKLNSYSPTGALADSPFPEAGEDGALVFDVEMAAAEKALKAAGTKIEEAVCGRHDEPGIQDEALRLLFQYFQRIGAR